MILPSRPVKIAIGHARFTTVGAHATTTFPEVVHDQVEHAAAISAPGPASPWFRNSGFERWKALCGARIAVVLPEFFDEDSARACEKCALELDVIHNSDREIAWDKIIR